MASEAKTERRKLEFKIVDAESNVILVKEPFESAATDAELANYVNSSIKKINEIRAFLESVPKVKQMLSEPQTVTLYLREYGSDASREIMTLQVREGQRATLDAMCAAMVNGMEAFITANIGITYSAMVAKIERDGLDIYKTTDAQWREVCTLHPLYPFHWDMEQKAAFEKRAKESILSGLRDGIYKLKGFKPKGKKRDRR